MDSQALQEPSLHSDASVQRLCDVTQVLAGMLIKDCLRSTFTFWYGSSSQGCLQALQHIDLSAYHFNHALVLTCGCPATAAEGM